jgi:hypothetical protein
MVRNGIFVVTFIGCCRTFHLSNEYKSLAPPPGKRGSIANIVVGWLHQALVVARLVDVDVLFRDGGKVKRNGSVI